MHIGLRKSSHWLLTAALVTGCAGEGETETGQIIEVGEAGPEDAGQFLYDVGLPPPRFDVGAADGAAPAFDAALPRTDLAVGPPGPDDGVGPGPDPDAGGTPAERPPNLVAAIVLTEQPQVPLAAASVGISPPVPISQLPGCVTTPVNPDAPAPPVAGYDGGQITVTGLTPGQVVFIPAGSTDQGYFYGPDRALGDDLFADGALLGATTAGGSQFGAFDLQVQAPARVRISAPQTRFGETFSTRSALDVRWDAGGAESLLITLTPVSVEGLEEIEPQAGTWAFCGTADNGVFSIPAETLRAVAPDPGFFGQAVLVAVTRTRVSQQTLGPDQVVLTASTSEGVLVTLAE